MGDTSLKILLVEDNEGDAMLVQLMLKRVTTVQFEISLVGSLKSAVACLKEQRYDAVLLDLGLPDSRGIKTFYTLHSEIHDVPIVVFTANIYEETIGIKAVRFGAQDYLVKGKVNEQLLARTIRYAIERNRLVIELKESLKREQQAKEEAEALRSRQNYLAISGGKGENQGGAEHCPASDATKEMASRYRELMLLYILAVRDRRERPADRVQRLEKDLTKACNRACDVVRLHFEVLNNFSKRQTPVGLRAFYSDANLFLVELLGNIIDIYHNSVDENNLERERAENKAENKLENSKEVEAKA